MEEHNTNLAVLYVSLKYVCLAERFERVGFRKICDAGIIRYNININFSNEQTNQATGIGDLHGKMPRRHH